MSWREYEILGAYRDSGEPARLQVEAANEADAADFAASKGILISRVVDRTAQREQSDNDAAPTNDASPNDHPVPSPELSALADPATRVRSGSRLVPNVPLLEGERILATFDASPSEVGLRGVLFASKRTLTLTTYRLVAEERSLLNASSSVVWLRSVEATRVGPHLWILQLILGSMVSASSLTLFLVSALGAASILALGSSTGTPAALDTTTALLVSLGMLPLIAGVALTRASFRRFVGVHAAGRPVGIYLRRVRAQRIEPFTSELSQAIHHANAPPDPPASP